MIYTKEEFKKLWEADDEGSVVTCDDIADCAKAWGLYETPRVKHILYKVLVAAGVEDAEDFNPQKQNK